MWYIAARWKAEKVESTRDAFKIYLFSVNLQCIDFAVCCECGAKSEKQQEWNIESILCHSGQKKKLFLTKPFG